jgi:hypothetical protein
MGVLCTSYQHESLHVLPGERHLGGLVFVHVEQYVKNVLLIPLAAVLPLLPPLSVPRRENPLHHGVKLAVEGIDALAEALHVPVPERADVVLQVERAGEHGRLGDDAPELLGAVVIAGPPPAHHHPRDDVAGEAHERGVHVHGRGALPRQGGHEAGDLLAADVGEAVQGAAGEELVHARLLHEAPEGPVGREGEVLAAVGEAVHRRRLGPVEERGLAGLEHLSGGVRGAGRDARHGAEPEEEERAVPLGQAVQRLVR